MARSKKYIVASNGKPHLFNSATGKSFCGRVEMGANGTRLTDTLPKGAVVCQRDVQLSSVAGKPAETVATVTETVTVPDVPAKAVPKPRKALQRVAGSAVDSQADYEPVMTWLAQNGIGTSIESDLSGDWLSFDHNGWVYSVRSPENTANGPDEGWEVSYNDDPTSNDPTSADESMVTAADVIEWLARDLDLDAAAKPVKEAVKRTATPAKPKPAAKPAASKTPGVTLNVNLFGPLMSTAFGSLVSAQEIAKATGIDDTATLDLLAQTIEAVKELRNSLAPLGK